MNDKIRERFEALSVVLQRTVEDVVREAGPPEWFGYNDKRAGVEGQYVAVPMEEFEAMKEAVKAISDFATETLRLYSGEGSEGAESKSTSKPSSSSKSSKSSK